jgi:beta-galactosidase
MDADFSRYKVVIAPMLYMVREGVGERITQFVAAGGTLVSTYWSGIVDDSTLCFTNGFPGPLREVLGIRSEEIDVLYTDEIVSVLPSPSSGLPDTYQAGIFCDLLHAETAEVMATYGSEFYAGRPALTRNRHGQGTAWYVAFRAGENFLSDLADRLIADAGLHPVLGSGTRLPTGVTAQMRSHGERQFVFVMNFTNQPQTVDLGSKRYRDMLTEEILSGSVSMEAYAVFALEKRD